MRGFFIPFGTNEEHQTKLKAGLARMRSDFTAKLCGMCDGAGEYRQTYTAGCGGGYYSSMGDCEYCGGTGLRQGYKPAAESVVHQVLNAAAR